MFPKYSSHRLYCGMYFGLWTNMELADSPFRMFIYHTFHLSYNLHSAGENINLVKSIDFDCFYHADQLKPAGLASYHILLAFQL